MKGWPKYLKSHVALITPISISKALIKAIFAKSKQTYGSPRIHAELKSKGYNINEKKVARLIHLHSIKALTKARFRTRSKKLDCHIAPNLLGGDFSCTRPNEKWATDISYIRTNNGWTYLAVIIDLVSNRTNFTF